MGIKGLSAGVIKLAWRDAQLSDFAGRTIGIDADLIHKAAVSNAKDIVLERPNSTKHHAVFTAKLQPTIHALGASKTVLVFSGAAWPLKARTHARRHNKRSQALTQATAAHDLGDVAGAEKLFKQAVKPPDSFLTWAINHAQSVGVTVVVAPYEHPRPYPLTQSPPPPTIWAMPIREWNRFCRAMRGNTRHRQCDICRRWTGSKSTVLRAVKDASGTELGRVCESCRHRARERDAQGQLGPPDMNVLAQMMQANSFGEEQLAAPSSSTSSSGSSSTTKTSSACSGTAIVATTRSRKAAAAAVEEAPDGCDAAGEKQLKKQQRLNDVEESQYSGDVEMDDIEASVGGGEDTWDDAPTTSGEATVVVVGAAAGELSEMEKRRLNTIRENKAKLVALGLADGSTAILKEDEPKCPSTELTFKAAQSLMRRHNTAIRQHMETTVLPVVCGEARTNGRQFPGKRTAMPSESPKSLKSPNIDMWNGPIAVGDICGYYDRKYLIACPSPSFALGSTEHVCVTVALQVNAGSGRWTWLTLPMAKQDVEEASSRVTAAQATVRAAKAATKPITPTKRVTAAAAATAAAATAAATAAASAAAARAAAARAAATVRLHDAEADLRTAQASAMSATALVEKFLRPVNLDLYAPQNYAHVTREPEFMMTTPTETMATSNDAMGAATTRLARRKQNCELGAGARSGTGDTGRVEQPRQAHSCEGLHAVFLARRGAYCLVCGASMGRGDEAKAPCSGCGTELPHMAQRNGHAPPSRTTDLMMELALLANKRIHSDDTAATRQQPTLRVPLALTIANENSDSEDSEVGEVVSEGLSDDEDGDGGERYGGNEYRPIGFEHLAPRMAFDPSGPLNLNAVTTNASDDVDAQAGSVAMSTEHTDNSTVEPDGHARSDEDTEDESSGNEAYRPPNMLSDKQLKRCKETIAYFTGGSSGRCVRRLGGKGDDEADEGFGTEYKPVRDMTIMGAGEEGRRKTELVMQEAMGSGAFYSDEGNPDDPHVYRSGFTEHGHAVLHGNGDLLRSALSDAMGELAYSSKRLGEGADAMRIGVVEAYTIAKLVQGHACLDPLYGPPKDQKRHHTSLMYNDGLWATAGERAKDGTSGLTYVATVKGGALLHVATDSDDLLPDGAELKHQTFPPVPEQWRHPETELYHQVLLHITNRIIVLCDSLTKAFASPIMYVQCVSALSDDFRFGGADEAFPSTVSSVSTYIAGPASLDQLPPLYKGGPGGGGRGLSWAEAVDTLHVVEEALNELRANMVKYCFDRGKDELPWIRREIFDINDMSRWEASLRPDAVTPMRGAKGSVGQRVELHDGVEAVKTAHRDVLRLQTNGDSVYYCSEYMSLTCKATQQYDTELEAAMSGARERDRVLRLTATPAARVDATTLTLAQALRRWLEAIGFHYDHKDKIGMNTLERKRFTAPTSVIGLAIGVNAHDGSDHGGTVLIDRGPMEDGHHQYPRDSDDAVTANELAVQQLEGARRFRIGHGAKMTILMASLGKGCCVHGGEPTDVMSLRNVLYCSEAASVASHLEERVREDSDGKKKAHRFTVEQRRKLRENELLRKTMGYRIKQALRTENVVTLPDDLKCSVARFVLDEHARACIGGMFLRELRWSKANRAFHHLLQLKSNGNFAPCVVPFVERRFAQSCEIETGAVVVDNNARVAMQQLGEALRADAKDMDDASIDRAYFILMHVLCRLNADVHVRAIRLLATAACCALRRMLLDVTVSGVDAHTRRVKHRPPDECATELRLYEALLELLSSLWVWRKRQTTVYKGKAQPPANHTVDGRFYRSRRLGNGLAKEKERPPTATSQGATWVRWKRLLTSLVRTTPSDATVALAMDSEAWTQHCTAKLHEVAGVYGTVTARERDWYVFVGNGVGSHTPRATPRATRYRTARIGAGALKGLYWLLEEFTRSAPSADMKFDRKQNSLSQADVASLLETACGAHAIYEDVWKKAMVHMKTLLVLSVKDGVARRQAQRVWDHFEEFMTRMGTLGPPPFSVLENGLCDGTKLRQGQRAPPFARKGYLLGGERTAYGSLPHPGDSVILHLTWSTGDGDVWHVELKQVALPGPIEVDDE